MRNLLVLAVALSACTQNPATNGDGGGGGDVDLAGMVGVTDGGTIGQDASIGPDDIVLEMTPFLVPAGGEAFRCQNFANPLGQKIEVAEWESHMPKGSHHLLLFYKNNLANGALETCSGLEFDAGPYGAQTPDAKIVYPAGVAAVMEANQGLRFASHYLNASQKDIMATVQLIIRKAKPGTVVNRAGVFFFNKIDLLVPTGKSMISKTCKVPRDVYFMFSTGHVHQRATNITAKVGDMTIFSSSTWDFMPFQEYAPPLFLPANTSVTFTCSYQNDTGKPLLFGESAADNEMCIFDGQFYPDPTGADFGC